MGNWVEKAHAVTWRYIGGRWYMVTASNVALTTSVSRNSNGS